MDDVVSTPAEPGAASGPSSESPSTASVPRLLCPACGAERAEDAAFCEACGHDFASPTPGADQGTVSSPPPVAAGETQARHTPVRQETAQAGEESPLDVGWTGPVAGGAVAVAVAPPEGARCAQCGEGFYLDGYCDQCGGKEPDPRDHFVETPAAWVAGVCDIGKRHTRNEDGMALLAQEPTLSHAVLVVCDGVSNTTDSHIASLAAARAAREVLAAPIPQAMGLREALVAAVHRRFADAVTAARRAVVETTPATGPGATETPPSCTFVAALVHDGLAVVGNVGDSRAYWLPDNPASEPRQLSTDDSFAAEQIRDGIPRKEAETGPQAHAITRWLGVDSPPDLAPHLDQVQLAEPGWLLVCSDGLWNYCSDAHDLRDLVGRTVAALSPVGSPSQATPGAVAQALVDFANGCGGMDNISAALARVPGPDGIPTVVVPVHEPAPAPAPEGDGADGNLPH